MTQIIIETSNFNNQDSVPRVAVVLGYYNGKKFINEQINSIWEQSLPVTKIFVFDDCSNEDECFDLNDFDNQKRSIITFVRRAENIGFAKNFLTALNEINENFDYFCFADQDDIWHEDKLKKAISVLSSKSKIPSLYCGSTQLYSHDMSVNLGCSPIFGNPSFDNAIVQSIAGGNTMVFNSVAKSVICNFTKGFNVASHDWWAYQVITAIGGYVYYDKEPYVKYRQHVNNQIGSNKGLIASINRLSLALKGRYKTWNDLNTKALLANLEHLTEINQVKLLQFIKVKNGKVWYRISQSRFLTVSRFGRMERVLFKVLLFFGRV